MFILFLISTAKSSDFCSSAKTQKTHGTFRFDKEWYQPERRSKLWRVGLFEEMGFEPRQELTARDGGKRLRSVVGGRCAKELKV